MTIDAIISEARAMRAEERIAALERALRHYYFKSMRLEQPLTLVVRGGRVVAVPNRIGLNYLRKVRPAHLHGGEHSHRAQCPEGGSRERSTTV